MTKNKEVLRKDGAGKKENRFQTESAPNGQRWNRLRKEINNSSIGL